MREDRNMGSTGSVRGISGALLTLGLAGLAFTPSPAAAGDPADGAALGAIVREAMATGLTPGLAVAVVKAERIVWEQGFGAADLETGREVTPGTAFYIASTTKALTALAAARLAARSELDLEAPLSRAFPAARFGPGVDPDSIHVRDLLTHTHGIEEDGPISIRVAFTGEFTNEELLALLGEHPAAKEGRTFAYSNLGYDLIGILLAPSRTGGWKEVVDREVIRPLNMTSTTAYRSRVETAAIAEPHELGPAGFARIRLAKEDPNMGPAGGHFSTAHDLARLLLAELGSGRVDGVSAVPAAVIAETQRLHAVQEDSGTYFHRHGWGLGWDLGTYERNTLIHRGGSFPGYRSHVSFMPERGIGVVVLANGGAASSDLADLVAAALYDHLLGRSDTEARLRERAARLEVFRQRALAAISADHAKRAARSQVLPRPREEYAGRYVSPTLGTLELLLLADGRLEAVMGVARSPIEVYNAEKNQLRAELFGRGSVLAVDFHAAGQAASAVQLMNTTFTRTRH
jgi:CubicO group peptidase (beta-lactamase class C family)